MAKNLVVRPCFAGCGREARTVKAYYCEWCRDERKKKPRARDRVREPKPCARCGENLRRSPRALYCERCYQEAPGAAARRWKERNPEKADRVRRASNLRKNYGIDLDDYERLLEEQHGVCAVCGLPPGERSLHVDHCHQTQKVRGLLCGQCNVALGMLNDDPARIEALVEYVKGGGA